jgi:2-polyprenyl-3-methyl-5-hydroxy-6-metoxy-1,4-benzoquinol methylase
MNDYQTRLRNALIDQHKLVFDYEKKRLRDEFAEHLNCPVCGSDRNSVYMRKDFFTFTQCAACSMVFLNPRLNNTATHAFYNSMWNSIYNELKFDATTASTALDDKINLSNLMSIGQIRPPRKGDSLLEIGSAKGYFLKKARDQGYNVYGIELNQKNYELTRREIGDTIFNKDLFDLKFEPEFFDVIYMRDVFEHVPNPKEMLQEIHRIAKKNCILYIEVPNIEGLIYRMVGEKHVVVFGFEHLNYWSPTTLSAVLSSTGFYVDKIMHASLDFNLRYLTSYLADQQFTAIQANPINPVLRTMLKVIQGICSLSPFQYLDNLILPWLANTLHRGSVIKVIARKR